MATSARPLHILALASKNTGDGFVRRARERGARVSLLTKASNLHARPWPRDLLDDVWAEPDDLPLSHTIDTVSWLAERAPFDRVVPFGDLEVDAALRLREHLCLPGLGADVVRLFRDKLAMRLRARALGIPVPDFTAVLRRDDVREFVARVPPPWMLKPRTDAATAGIRKIHDADALFAALAELGDRASHHLLERYEPGDVHHVDALVSQGEIVFAEVHANGTPPFDVAQGGVYSSYTVERGSADWRALEALNARILRGFGLGRGVTHVEYIKRREDGEMLFLEAGARVGGAHIARLVEATTGVDLWAAYADLEIDQGGAPLVLPPRRHDHGGLVQALSRTVEPDLSAYADPEIVARVGDAHHAGLVLASPSYARARALVDDYARRFADDFLAVLPPPPR